MNILSMKKIFCILCILYFVPKTDAMEKEPYGDVPKRYIIATSKNNQAFEQISTLEQISNSSRDVIDSIVRNDQHIIFMLQTNNAMNTILETINHFITLATKTPKVVFKNFLYSGGFVDEEMGEEEGMQASHNSLVMGDNVKQQYGYAIQSVYSPPLKKGFAIEFDQARVFYKIVDPKQLIEFWHTEPTALEQFLLWKLKNPLMKNVIIVSKKPMCLFCSKFLLHCFCI